MWILFSTTLFCASVELIPDNTVAWYPTVTSQPRHLFFSISVSFSWQPWVSESFSFFITSRTSWACQSLELVRNLLWQEKWLLHGSNQTLMGLIEDYSPIKLNSLTGTRGHVALPITGSNIMLPLWNLGHNKDISRAAKDLPCDLYTQNRTNSYNKGNTLCS